MSTMSRVETEWQPYASEVLAGDGMAAARLRLQISRIAPHFRTALVTGERGTGKQTVARELHRLSGLAADPFVMMEIGAFAEVKTRVELRGVLYLTGLDRMDPGMQERLVERLRAVQREVRIVVASECDLRGMLATGRMRQTLAARVGSLEIRMPALRDRVEDLKEAAAAMLLRHGSGGRFSLEALHVLEKHGWPGNLAELWQVTERVAGFEGEIAAKELPELAAREVANDSGARLDKVMQRHVFEVLQRCSGNKLRAAEVLGISRSTLYRMLEAAVE